MRSNATSLWRHSLARQLGEIYRTDPGIAALGVTGSTAYGRADRYSDIEVLSVWHELPQHSTLEHLAARVDATRRRIFIDDGPTESDIGEEYLIHGVKIDLSHTSVDTVERLLTDVLERYDASLAKQHVLAAIQHAIPLFGPNLFDRCQERLAGYPHALSVAMVRRHMDFGPHSWLMILAQRGDFLELHDIYVRAAKNIVNTLLGLNRIYHPGYKWIDATIAEMTICPANLAAGLRSVFSAAPVSGALQLDEIIGELIALVEAHMPEVDTAPIRRRFRQQRPEWPEPPPELRLE
jgi:predicted nucleotidyltransferase